MTNCGARLQAGNATACRRVRRSVLAPVATMGWALHASVLALAAGELAEHAAGRPSSTRRALQEWGATFVALHLAPNVAGSSKNTQGGC